MINQLSMPHHQVYPSYPQCTQASSPRSIAPYPFASINNTSLNSYSHHASGHPYLSSYAPNITSCGPCPSPTREMNAGNILPTHCNYGHSSDFEHSTPSPSMGYVQNVYHSYNYGSNYITSSPEVILPLLPIVGDSSHRALVDSELSNDISVCEEKPHLSGSISTPGSGNNNSVAGGNNNNNNNNNNSNNNNNNNNSNNNSNNSNTSNSNNGSGTDLIKSEEDAINSLLSGNCGNRPTSSRSPYEWMKKSSYQSQQQPGKTRTRDKYRVVYSDHQRLELEKEFHSSHYITIKRKSELAFSLQLSERQVKIWFQNRRAKERKQMKKKEESKHKDFNQTPLLYHGDPQMYNQINY